MDGTSSHPYEVTTEQFGLSQDTAHILSNTRSEKGQEQIIATYIL